MDKPKKGMDPTLLDRISYFCQMDVLKEYLTALIHMEVVYISNENVENWVFLSAFRQYLEWLFFSFNLFYFLV